ncbi:MAG: amidohydrolase family protein, partial [Peptococcaceae bacterium]|nr:amidohydrolase family protein [Peptococcaceae bacterium]
DKPLFMVKYDGHACVVNTKLLDKIRDKASNLRGYHEDTGEMNQEAFFAVSDYVTNSIPILKLVENMQQAVDDLAAKGIGMIHTVSGVGFTADLDVDLERWFARGLDNGMQMRVFMQTMDVKKATKRKLPRIGGCFEAALDGCFGSMDAALLAPYEGTEDTGVLYYSDETVIEFCKKANRAGLQISIHAIGDRAFTQAVYALQAALDDYPRDNHRHSIIHACLPTEEGIAICRQYNILLPVQSAFINWVQEPDAYLEEILGNRAAKLNPLATFTNHDILLCAGSDGPCTDPDPIQWMHKACNHSVANQALTIQQALRMCTYNGYYATFDEEERGSLEVGKIADMVVLSGNPYQMPTDSLNTLQVQQLLLGGKPYRPLKKGAIGHIVRGMLSK